MNLYRRTYTFDEIFNIIKNKINESTTKVSFWGDSGLATSIIKAIAFIIAEIQLQINIIVLSNKLSTSWGRHLDNFFEDFNFSRKNDTYAIAVQEFIGKNDRVDDIIIPANTTVSTEKDYYGNTIKYSLISDLFLPLSENSVTGYVVCKEIGTIGNNLMNTINILDSDVDGIASTTNIEDISNGSNIEKDSEAKDRFTTYLLSLKNADESAISNAVNSVEGITYSEVISNFPSNGTFTVFCSTESGIVDSVLKAKIMNKVKKVKAFGIIPNVISPIINYVDIRLDVRLNTNDYNSVLLIQLIKNRLMNFVNLKSKYQLYKSDIIQEIKKINGVIDIQEVYINNIDQSYILTKNNTIKVQDIDDIEINIL